MLVLHNVTAKTRVRASAINGAIQIALLPKRIGIQKIARAFTTIPLLMAMIFAAPVLFVEKRKAVKIKFNAIGINDRLNIGKAAVAVCIKSASLLKMRMTGTSKKNRPL